MKKKNTAPKIRRLPLGWNPIADTANRNLKKRLACKILSE